MGDTIKKWDWDTISKKATTVLCIFTFFIFIIALLNYSEFVDNVELTAKNIELTAKNIELTHKPIVFIRGTMPPSSESNDPFKHGFIITNTGKLPARNVRILVKINQVAGTNIGLNNSQNIPVLEQATIYPSSDLVFWIDRVIDLGQTPTKAEANFTISYNSEASDEEVSENMKFVFSIDTNYNWIYVGPKIDIFTEERKKINSN